MVDQADIAQGIDLSRPVAPHLKQGQCLLEIGQGLLVIVQRHIDCANAAQHFRLPPHDAAGVLDRLRLLEKRQGLFIVAQVRVDRPDAAQGDRLPLRLADLAVDGDR